MPCPKDSFYKKLKLPKDVTDIMKAFKKIKKLMMKDATISGIGK